MSVQDVACNKEEEKPITLPLWQMMQEEKEPAPEDEDKSDRFNCLTSRVRACYLRNLEKVLLNNYEECSEFPFSKEQVMKAAEQLEGRALRSCMVVILYQRAMMRLTADIKKHTQQLKLYRRLHEIVNSSYGSQDKEVQTITEYFLTDGSTQTDSYEIPVIKSEPPEPTEKPMTEALCTEPQPIPVLVSGVAMTKPFPEYNTFQSTSSQVTNHDKENLVPTKTDKDKVHYKRNTKDLSSREPKISSPPKRPCLRVKSLSLLQKPVAPNGAMPPLPTVPLSETMDKRISKKEKKKIVEAVPDIPLPPCPPPPPPAAVKEAPAASPEGDDCSSPRMSIEERLAIVFNIPIESAQASSPSQKQGRTAAKGRRMSIEERLEAVFRGETINDEDVQSDDDNPAQQANESMETLKNEDIPPQHSTAPPQLKLRFIELFGHESDGEEEEDNEPPYKDKIARWVVECLMPYYRQKLIANRPLFKRLARHIADTVMVNKPLPDKSDVDDCVTEFFSYHSSVSSERDIN